MKKVKLLKLIKNFRYRLSLNLKYFIVKNLGSRVNKYKFIGFNAGWIIGKIKNLIFLFILDRKIQKM